MAISWKDILSNQTPGISPNPISWQDLLRLKNPNLIDYISNTKDEQRRPSAEKSPVSWENLFKMGGVAVPLISGLLSKGSFEPSLGPVLGGLTSIISPKAAPAGYFAGQTIGNLLKGMNLPSAVVGALPSTAISALGAFLPKDLKPIANIASPMISGVLSNLLTGSTAGWGTVSPAVSSALGGLGLGSLAPVLAYSGPIGMVLGAVGNVISDIISTRKEKEAEKKMEKSIIDQLRKNEFLNQLYSALNPQGGNYLDYLKTLPDWAQMMFSPAGFLYHYSERPLKEGPVGLGLSPLFTMFKNMPEATQDLVKQALDALKAQKTQFEAWEQLNDIQKALVLDKLSSIVGSSYLNPYNLGPKRYEQFIKETGIPQDKLFDIIAGGMGELARIAKSHPQFNPKYPLEAYLEGSELYRTLREKTLSSILGGLGGSMPEDFWDKFKFYVTKAYPTLPKETISALYRVLSAYSSLPEVLPPSSPGTP